MWSYYYWVVVVVVCQYPIIIRPHCIFTDRRQQRQPNHNMTTYCVYGRTKTTINTILIRPHCMFTDRRQQRQPNHNMTTYCVYGRTKTTINTILIRPHCMFTDRRQVLSLGCRCCRLSVNTICGCIMIGFIVVVVRQ
jgi:hypothetical protein